MAGTFCLSVEMNSLEKHRRWLDVLKGWGIIFIVLGHIVGGGVHLSTGTSQVFCDLSYKYLYAFHVPLFFFVAGMTFRTCTWRCFLEGKTRRLLIPYFFFGTMSILFYWLLKDVAASLLIGSDTTGYYTFKSDGLPLWWQGVNLLLGGWWTLGFVANSVLWFVPVLFSLEMAAWGCSQIFHAKWVWGVVGIMVLVGYSALGPVPKLPWGLHLVPKYFPYFVLGMFFGLREIIWRKHWMGWSIAFVLIVGSGWGAVMNPYQYFPKTILQHLLNFSLTTGCILGWLLFSQCLSLGVVAKFGTWSLGIMLMHKFPMLFLQNFIVPVRDLFTGSLVSLSFGVVVVFLFVMVCCAFACQWILRYFPILLGGRRLTKEKL